MLKVDDLLKLENKFLNLITFIAGVSRAEYVHMKTELRQFSNDYPTTPLKVASHEDGHVVCSSITQSQ
ncbi:hypothetical protein Pelo_19879 [Pelomyxa schiedti]|nr:hypothetical protein Pelo_19879 [Pelomyxa schiedti]